MKKLFLVMLVCFTLVVCMTGCSLFDDNSGSKVETTPEVTPAVTPETTADVSTSERPETTLAPETTPAPETPSTTFVELSAEDSGPVKAIFDLWQSLEYDYEMFDDNIAQKIREIKSGIQGLIVRIEAEKCYFVVAYYNSDHGGEAIHHCCAKEYTWVRVENAGDIVDSYKGQNFILAFQFNPATYVADMLFDDTYVPEFEYFNKYEPEFSLGKNIESYDECSQSFLYANYPNESGDNREEYFSPMSPFWGFHNEQCIWFETEVYLTVLIKKTYPLPGTDPYVYEYKLEYEFGEYYSDLIKLLQPNGHTTKNDCGVTSYYGYISVDRLAKLIRKKINE